MGLFEREVEREGWVGGGVGEVEREGWVMECARRRRRRRNAVDGVLDEEKVMSVGSLCK